MADNLLDFQLRIRGPEGERTFQNARKGLEAFAKDIGQAVSVREVNPIIAAVLKSHLKLVAEAMVQRQYHVYLVDYRLGADDGLALMQEAIQAGCREPIIMLTGQTGMELDLQAMKAGAVDFLQKPFGPEVLLAKVKNALARPTTGSRKTARTASYISK